jgi:hypothetical protein
LTSQTAHDDLSWIRLLSTSSMHHQRHRRHPIFSIQPSKCPDSRFRTRKNGPRTRSSRTSPDTYYNAQCCSTRRQVTHRSSATVITPHHLGLLAGILQRNASKIIRQVHERQDEAIETSPLLVRHPETPDGMSQRCSFDNAHLNAEMPISLSSTLYHQSDVVRYISRFWCRSLTFSVFTETRMYI